MFYGLICVLTSPEPVWVERNRGACYKHLRDSVVEFANPADLIVVPQGVCHRLGTQRAQFPDSQSRTVMGGVVTLQVLDGADRGRIFENLTPTITIGREEGNTIQLNDERVSRFHLKIQDDQSQYVLTDLESTNGTKVNGEDIHLRILRYGDMISVGRSVLLFGSREQIAERLAQMRGGEVAPERTVEADADAEADPPPPEKASLDFEINWGDEMVGQSTLHSLLPPDLPARLSPGQAAQLCEVLEYLHIRIRDLLASVKVDDKTELATLEQRQWQNMLDLQARLAAYLRAIAEPQE